LSQNEIDIFIDGDSFVLAKWDTLQSIANNVADNLTLLIINNGSYGSTSDQPTNV
jgi:sulfopyruvate decarboxylase subunit beta